MEYFYQKLKSSSIRGTCKRKTQTKHNEAVLIILNFDSSQEQHATGFGINQIG